MAGPLQVVVDGRRDGRFVEVVPQPVEDGLQLVCGQQVEQHQDVGLLGRLVGVGAEVLLLEDAVETGDVTVSPAVEIPVQLGERLVSLELADHPVLVANDPHLVAHVLPEGQFRVVERQLLSQLAPPRLGKQLDQLECPAQHPDGHHVGVGVVVQSRFGSACVAVVVFVRPHDALDLVAVEGRVVAGDTRPEPTDLEDHLRPVGDHELEVRRGLEVVPDVVGDRRIDVSLEMGRIGQPPAGERIEVQCLGLLATVAAALPRVHGTGGAGLRGRPPCLRQPPEAVEQQRSDQLGEVHRQIGEDEQLVPEHVAPVGLTVQAPGGDSGVEVDGVA